MPTHPVQWVVGPPQLDAPHDVSDEKGSENEADAGMSDPKVAHALSRFYDRVYTEWNILKMKYCSEQNVPGYRNSMSKKQQRETLGADRVSAETQLFFLNAACSDASITSRSKCC